MIYFFIFFSFEKVLKKEYDRFYGIWQIYFPSCGTEKSIKFCAYKLVNQ